MFVFQNAAEDYVHNIAVSVSPYHSYVQICKANRFDRENEIVICFRSIHFRRAPRAPLLHNIDWQLFFLCIFLGCVVPLDKLKVFLSLSCREIVSVLVYMYPYNLDSHIGRTSKLSLTTWELLMILLPTVLQDLPSRGKPITIAIN